MKVEFEKQVKCKVCNEVLTSIDVKKGYKDCPRCWRDIPQGERYRPSQEVLDKVNKEYGHGS